jgi:hypothetical protein
VGVLLRRKLALFRNERSCPVSPLEYSQCKPLYLYVGIQGINNIFIRSRLHLHSTSRGHRLPIYARGLLSIVFAIFFVVIPILPFYSLSLSRCQSKTDTISTGVQRQDGFHRGSRPSNHCGNVCSDGPCHRVSSSANLLQAVQQPTTMVGRLCTWTILGMCTVVDLVVMFWFSRLTNSESLGDINHLGGSEYCQC